MLLASCGGNSTTTNTSAALSQAPAQTQAAAPASAQPSAQPSSAPAAPASDKVVTIAMTNAWDSLMPLNTNSNYSRLVYDQIYDKLTVGLSDGSYIPRLAKSWEVNADSTTITFTLNDNVVWHDGEPFTAADVVFTFQMYSDPEVEALSRYALQYIAGTDESGAETSADSIAVKALDDYTVEMTMKNAMFHETLLNDLDSVFIIPKHIFEGKTASEINAPTLWENPVGTGAYKYESKIEGERMEFTANTDYFQGTPNIGRLVVRIVPTANLLAGLMSGEIDTIAGGGLGAILLDDWDMAQEQDNLVTISIPTTSYQTLPINSQKPYMTEKVRQAFSMAINRDALVNSLLQGQGVAIVSPISPASPYFNPEIEVWYDPEQAKSILQEENFPFDQELVFFVPSGNTTRERAAALIQQDFQNIGVKVQIQSVDFPTLMDNMRNELHDFGIIGSGGSLDPSESRQMIDPASPVNFGRVTSSELTDLADAGTAALTFDERAPHFYAYQQRIKDTVPMAYLYTTNSLMAHGNHLSNLEPENFTSLYWPVWQWDTTK